MLADKLIAKHWKFLQGAMYASHEVNLHLTKLNTGVFDIHTTGTFVHHLLSHMKCISYCRSGLVPELVNAPVTQQVSFGSVAILVYTALFVSAVI